MTRLARRLRAALALALVVLSPSFEAPRLFSEEIGREPSVEKIPPALGVPADSPLALPGLSAEPIASAAPVPAFTPLAPAAPVASAAVPASAANREAVISRSEFIYRAHSLFLNVVAARTGALYSRRAAGPALRRKVIKAAAGKLAAFLDLDKTIVHQNQALEPVMVRRIEAARAAGKEVAFISDRGDVTSADQMSVQDSLAPLPIRTRAGVYFAASSGARIYRYDGNGEPIPMFEARPFDMDTKANIRAAAEATKARLKEAGIEIHVPSGTDKNPTERLDAHSYALMLKAGTSDKTAREAAAIFQQEVDEARRRSNRGLALEVKARPVPFPGRPYVTIKIVTKETATAYIAEALGLKAGDVALVGDNMYEPRQPERSSWLARLGERVSGRAIPLSGNRTDADMEKALSGALTLCVGAAGDPRPANLWVLGGGLAVSEEILRSFASKPRAAIEARKKVLAAAVLAACVAALALAFSLWIGGLIDGVVQFEQALRAAMAEMIDWR